MPKKDVVEYSFTFRTTGSDDPNDKEVQAKAKKLIKEFECLGFKVEDASLSSGHLRGGTVSLTEEAAPDGDKR